MQKNKIAGVGLVEVMVAVTLLLFVSYAVLKILSLGHSSSKHLSKKVELADHLDERVAEYILTGVFNNSVSEDFSFVSNEITNEGNNGNGNGNSTTYGNPSGGETGNSTSIDYNVFEFIATDSTNNITTNQKSFNKD